MKQYKCYKVAFSTLIIFCTLFFSSCDNRETEAKKNFEQKVSSESKGKIKVTSFKKTNGIEQDFMGMKGYTIEWDAEITAIKEVWRMGSFTNGFHCSDKELQPDYWSNFLSGGVSHLQIGTVLKLRGSSGLQKTDNGWIVNDVRFNIAQ